MPLDKLKNPSSDDIIANHRHQANVRAKSMQRQSRIRDRSPCSEIRRPYFKELPRRSKCFKANMLHLREQIEAKMTTDNHINRFFHRKILYLLQYFCYRFI